MTFNIISDTDFNINYFGVNTIRILKSLQIQHQAIFKLSLPGTTKNLSQFLVMLSIFVYYTGVNIYIFRFMANLLFGCRILTGCIHMVLQCQLNLVDSRKLLLPSTIENVFT